MMNWRHVARVTIELMSPLSVGTGRAGGFEDNDVVRDANDLPTIPGTSLAGILRAIAPRAGFDEAEVKAIFGHEEAGEHSKGQRSRLTVSWASLNARSGSVVAPMMEPSERGRDPVLASAYSLVLRDHVRLDNRGVADKRGKFDRSSVMAGHRFSFELELRAEDGDLDAMDRLVALVAHPAFRLGGRTRMGLGHVRLVSYHAAAFDLGDEADYAAYGALPSALSESASALSKRPLPTATTTSGTMWTTLKLKPTEPWLVVGEHLDGINMAPLREAKVAWPPRGEAHLCAPQVLLPGASIKGALRHRAAFHLRRLEKIWAGPTPRPKKRGGSDELDPWCARDGMEPLFGQVHEERAGAKDERADGEAGLAGGVFIDDVWPKGAEAHPRIHVSIDRFTGAPMHGALFTDAPVHCDEVVVNITLSPLNEVPAGVRDAFMAAVEDLCAGRLQLGGGSGRGYGWFEADAPAWRGALEVTV